MKDEVIDGLLKAISNGDVKGETLDNARKNITKSKDSMTEEQFNALISALDKAQESETPFAVTSGDTFAVAGDANDTAVKKFDYEITFVKPKYENGKLVGETTEKKTYKNVFISPRRRTSVVKCITMLLPFLRKVKENGEVEDYSPLELAEVFSELDEQIYDAMYDLVAKVLDIPDADKEYMTVSSVLVAAINFLVNEPSTLNEADGFFGL